MHIINNNYNITRFKQDRVYIFKLLRGSKTLINKRLVKFCKIVLSIVKLFQRTIGIQQQCPVTMNKRIYIFYNIELKVMQQILSK